jgi:hypothetical protein
MVPPTQLLVKPLNDGRVVLAKMTKYGLSAYTFANKTQAQNAALRTRNAFPEVDAFVGASFRAPFFVNVVLK